MSKQLDELVIEVLQGNLLNTYDDLKAYCVTEKRQSIMKSDFFLTSMDLTSLILVPNQMDHTKNHFTIESEFQRLHFNIKEIESIGRK